MKGLLLEQYLRLFAPPATAINKRHHNGSRTQNIRLMAVFYSNKKQEKVQDDTLDAHDKGRCWCWITEGDTSMARTRSANSVAGVCHPVREE